MTSVHIYHDASEEESMSAMLPKCFSAAYLKGGMAEISAGDL